MNVCRDIFQLCLDTHYWTAVNQFFIWGSLAAYFAITFTMFSNGMFLIFTYVFPFIGKNAQPVCGLNPKTFKCMKHCDTVRLCADFLPLFPLGTSGTARNSLNQPNVWLTIFLTTLLCILPVVALRFLLIMLRPTINDKVREHMMQRGSSHVWICVIMQIQKFRFLSLSRHVTFINNKCQDMEGLGSSPGGT